MHIKDILALMRDIGYSSFDDDEEILEEHPEAEIPYVTANLEIVASLHAQMVEALEDFDKNLLRVAEEVYLPELYRMRAGIKAQIDRLERCGAGMLMFIRLKSGAYLN